MKLMKWWLSQSFFNVKTFKKYRKQPRITKTFYQKTWLTPGNIIFIAKIIISNLISCKNMFHVSDNKKFNMHVKILHKNNRNFVVALKKTSLTFYMHFIFHGISHRNLLFKIVKKICLNDRKRWHKKLTFLTIFLRY